MCGRVSTARSRSAARSISTVRASSRVMPRRTRSSATAGVDRELARRVVDAGDAGPLLGDHPPGDVLGDCRAISGLIAGLQLRCAIHSGRRLAAAGTIGRRRHGDFRGVSGHGFLLRLHGCVGVCGGAGLGRRVRLVHGCGLRLMGGGRPGDEPARNEVLTLAKAGGLIGADRHRRQLHRLPVDRPPDGNLAVLLDHLVGADGVADRDAADDPGADVLPERLHVLALREADDGAPLEGVSGHRDPRPLDDAQNVQQVVGAVRVQQRCAGVEPGEIDVPGIERQHLVVAAAGEQIAPPHRCAGRPEDLDGARLGVDAVRLQAHIGARLQRQVDDVLFRRHGLFPSHVPGMITP